MGVGEKRERIIVDEGRSYLDIGDQLDLVEVVKEVNETHGMTILMVVDELEEGGKYCEGVIGMKGGEV
ncbi:hypothetical protein [Bacillus sp. WP8]|uniref:hypothetical protein n=1 Tax=Bacillus sp. WP8 TaxID=756828 RepID=UPI0011A10654|nr:hypothetical protein [Bacillus sp. WP8]